MSNADKDFIYMKFYDHLVDNVGPLWLHTLFGKYATDKMPTEGTLLYDLIKKTLVSIHNMLSDECLEEAGLYHGLCDTTVEEAWPYLRAALEATRDAETNIWS
jgi:hypothetical protein